MNCLSLHRRVLFASAAVALMGLPHLAHAQGQAPAATPASNSGVQIEEVVITAQKRTERLQDVPVAAAVVGSSTLAQNNAGSLSDLNKVVPSVNLTGNINSKGALGIRGISSVSNQGAIGIISGVAVLLDGVPVPSDSFAAQQLEDVQRVEVLKGPQATLGGRSAAQGVINIVTKAPANFWTGNVSGTLTTDKERRVNGFLSGPLVADKLDFSVAAYDNSRDYPITNAYYGRKTHEDTYGTHAKLLLHANENLDVTLATAFSGDRITGGNLVYSYVAPGATILGRPGFLGQAQLLPGITPSLGNQVYNSPVSSAGFSAFDGSVSLNVDYRLGDYTLTSTTAFQSDAQKTVNDLFAVSQYFYNVLTNGASTFDNTQTLTKRSSQTSEELKLVSPADKPISYVVGAFYSDTPIVERQTRKFPGNPVTFFVSQGTRTFDLYGRSTWKLDSSNSIVTGLRYNYDQIRYDLNQTVNGAVGAFHSQGSDSSGALVGDVSLQHKFGSNVMVYGTYARGYAPKAYNTTATLTSNTPIAPVGEETINHFEIGSKGVYFNRRLTLDVAVFDTVYLNYQVQTYRTLPGSTVSTLDLSSAGQASTKGVEIDSTFKATRDLKLNLGLAYINAIFDKFTGASCYSYATVLPPECKLVNGFAVQDVSGRPMPNAPNFKLTAGAEQRFPLGSAPYEVVVGGLYTYQSAAQMIYDENPQAIVPAFGLLNLTAGITEKAGRYSATLFVNNVFDHHYPAFVGDMYNSAWRNNVVIVQPARDSSRYAGIRLTAAF
ncbi:MAG: hypothetical protein JWO72_1589 [Caulobacteraceae bacterium]|nr:hypothetical protein [Caulobacteraceae bacterium]